MFHHHGKKSKPATTKPLLELTAIATPEAMLAEGKRPALIGSMADNLNLDPPRFKTLCTALLHRYIDYCQTLPETVNNYYSLPGGMLDHALNRTEAALGLLRQHMIGDGNELSEEQNRWVYAMFSAGILKGIGKLFLDFKIELYDVHRQLITLWNPLTGSMDDRARYFHYEITGERDDDFRCRLNLLLARQIIPDAGFAWIAENKSVLASWLALINEDPNSAEMLGAILERAEAIAIQRDLNDLLVRQIAAANARPARIGTFSDVPVESELNRDRQLGAEFIQWLGKNIENGKFVIGRSPLLLVPAGVYMSPETFQLFMKDHPQVKHWLAVQKGLLSLGLHGFEGKQADNQAAQKIVLEKLGVILPDKLKLHHPDTGKETSVSAVELLRSHRKASGHQGQLQHLTRAGEWVSPENISPELQSGFRHRE